jgi:hypothetical protein
MRRWCNDIPQTDGDTEARCGQKSGIHYSRFQCPSLGWDMKISAAFSAHDNKAGCAEVDG